MSNNDKDVDFPLLPNECQQRRSLSLVYASNTVLHAFASLVGLSKGILVGVIVWFITGRVWLACTAVFVGVLSMTANGCLALISSKPSRVYLGEHEGGSRATAPKKGFNTLRDDFPTAKDAYELEVEGSSPRVGSFLSPYVGAATVTFSVIWGTLDFILSGTMAFFSFFMAASLTREPDKEVSEDWAVFHSLCIGSFSVCIFAGTVQFAALTMCVVAWAFSYSLRKCPAVHYGKRRCCKSLRDYCCARSRGHCCLSASFAFLIVASICTVVVLTVGPLVGTFTNSGSCSDEDQDCFSSCNEINPGVCLLPFPSTFYMRPDNTPTGWRVALGNKSTPLIRGLHNVHVDVGIFNEMDGFSVTAPALCFFDDLSLDGTIPVTNPEYYLNPDARTVLIDTTTGSRVAHWVELDGMDQKSPLLIIQPAQTLHHGTRYIIGIRGLLSNSGEPIPRAPHFNAVVSNQTGEESEYFYSQIFGYLEGDGWKLEEVLLSWDFVTISEEYSLGRAKLMLAASAPYYGSIQYHVEHVDIHNCDSNSSFTAKSIWGYFYAPMFVTDNRGGRLLSRPGAQTIQTLQELLKVQFLIEVPCSLILDPSPSFTMQYGHRMFRDRSEIQLSWIRELANKNKWVTYAVDWYGSSRLDLLVLWNVLFNDPDNFVSIPECTQQGFINANLMAHLMTNEMLTEPELQVSGISLIDPSKFGFYGNSEGGILGGAYIALSDMLERGITNVAGSPFALWLPRSSSFSFFNTIMINFLFYNQRDIRLMLSLFQILWDAGEVGGWLNALDKPLLIQAALNDPSVSNYATQFYSRSVNATLISPASQAVWPLLESDPSCCPPPNNGAWLVEWQYDNVPALPDSSAPPPDGAPKVNDCPQQEPEGQQQAAEFLETGNVVQFCAGVCRKTTACT
ncbi:LigA protein [Pelomyxa schiedti]|nr:LigA protein [Pelomyxa schiedti]